MQVGTVGFRQASVGGVAEEDVVEGVAVVARVGGRGGVDEAGACEREQVASDLAARERGDRTERELPPDDRRSLQNRPCRSVETSESSCEDGFERRRQPLAALGRERGQLLGVERVALGQLDDPIERLLVDRGGAGGDLPRLLLAERPERERLAQRPLQLRPCEAEDEQRRVGAVGEIVDQVDEGRLGPVDVVEDEEDGLRPRERLEQPPDSPVRLAERCGLCAFGERGEPGEHQFGVQLGRERTLRLGPAKRAEQRQEGGALAVGDAAGDEHRRARFLAQRQLAGEPGLADPRLADDRDHAAATLVASSRERRAEVGELLPAPGERRVEPALCTHERRCPLVESDPADTGELDGPRDDGSGTLDDLAGRDASGQAELACCQHRPFCVVVGGPVGAEEGDEPFWAEPLERAAVPVEHVSHRCKRLVEQPSEALGVLG